MYTSELNHEEFQYAVCSGVWTPEDSLKNIMQMLRCHPGYLPFDKSGDWFYQTCEALGFCLAGTMVYLGRAWETAGARFGTIPNMDELVNRYLWQIWGHHVELHWHFLELLESEYWLQITFM